MKRVAAGAIAILIALAGCTDEPSASDVAPTPVGAADPPRIARPQHLFTATIADPKTFNPIIATDAASRAAVCDVFDTLVRLDPRSGEMQPALAESWSFDTSGTTLTLALRRDVRWHDGEPLTARDVVFTFEALYSPQVPNPLAASLTFNGRRMALTAPDPHTVRIRVPHPFAPLLTSLAVPIVPAHRLEPALRNGTFAQQWGVDVAPHALVGSGPYRLERYEPGRLIHLVRNDGYWMRDDRGGPLPYLAEQTIRLVPDQDTARRAFLAGETDIHTPSPEEVRGLLAAQANGAFAVHEIGVDPGMLFVAFNRNPAHYKQNGRANPRLSWFTDAAFLRALAHGMDKATIVATVLDGFGEPAVSFVSPANHRFFNPYLADYPYHPARARALLEEGGYLDRDGDGIREDRHGHALEFALATNAGNGVREEIARHLQRTWQTELGVRVHLQPLAPSVLIDKLQSTFDWDAMLMGFTGSIDPYDAASLLRSNGPLHVWHPHQTRPATRWEAEIDELLDRAARSLDLEQRRRAYWRIQEILHEQLPIIQTVRPRRFSAASNALQNYEPTVWGVSRPERIRFVE
ncbi:MAG: ABC transporter substrate-binding protein [Candidatus Binatia bacterium]